MSRTCGGIVLLACWSMTGCGSSTGTVTGKVYFKEALVKGGKVTFFAADGRAIPSTIRDDGSYTVENVPPGTAKVCVDTRDLDPKRGKIYSAPPGKQQASSPPAGVFTAIPPKYAEPSSTDVTVEVTAGGQTFDIRLN